MKPATKVRFAGMSLVVMAALFLTFSGSRNVLAKRLPTANVVGAWFGIARPCPANVVTDSVEHAEFCQAICGLCPNAGVLPPEFPLMSTIKDDGTMIADDA